MTFNLKPLYPWHLCFCVCFTANDCPDCRGFPPDCSCEDYFFCKNQGCDTGECQPDCPGTLYDLSMNNWKAVYKDYLLEEWILVNIHLWYILSTIDQGQSLKNISSSFFSAERKRTMLGELLKRKRKLRTGEDKHGLQITNLKKVRLNFQDGLSVTYVNYRALYRVL